MKNNGSAMILSQKETGFKVYVDLFNKGDFNEIHIIPEKSSYQVMLDDIKLATITKDTQNSWVKVDGTMPCEKLEQVGNMISLKMNTWKD